MSTIFMCCVALDSEVNTAVVDAFHRDNLLPVVLQLLALFRRSSDLSTAAGESEIVALLSLLVTN